jgi:hypothetical protein
MFERFAIVPDVSGFRNVWKKMTSDRIPNNTEDPKVINPMPGFRGDPIPIRRDCVQIKMERSNQKRLLPRS